MTKIKKSKPKPKWPHYDTLEELLDNTVISYCSDDGKEIWRMKLGK